MEADFGLNVIRMERFQRHTRPGQPVSTAWEAEEGARRVEREKQSGGGIRHPAYRAAEAITGTLLCFMAVFTPWAFGTTQSWSIWTMNVTAYLLGGILFWKWSIRLSSGFRPARWDDASNQADEEQFKRANKAADWLTPALATLTILLLAYALVSVLNARAIYVEWDRRFVYRDCINWLPHSYDRDSSLIAFWMFSGWACFFWASRDWLLAKSARERHRQREHPGREHRTSSGFFPVRKCACARTERAPSRRSVGGARACRTGLSSIVGVMPEWLAAGLGGNSPAFKRNGPAALVAAADANAATGDAVRPVRVIGRTLRQHLNLLWPVSMGFWLDAPTFRPRLDARRETARLGQLPGAAAWRRTDGRMPDYFDQPRRRSGKRGLQLCGAVDYSLGDPEGVALDPAGSIAVVCGDIGLCGHSGMKQLLPRFQTIFEDRMSHRTEIYDNAVKMRHDFPAWGAVRRPFQLCTSFTDRPTRTGLITRTMTGWNCASASVGSALP